nr:retrovirus-related Pol polyprotein from transposon TNT 1-94 [Tanacetum cinerariifolium]
MMDGLEFTRMVIKDDGWLGVHEDGAARASDTNYVNTASTPVNAATTQLHTNQDDFQIPIQDLASLDFGLPFGKKVHRQEEGIDYDEVFAPVARIEAIRIFLAFASYMGFIVYQMDVKSAFLCGKINEEVKGLKFSGKITPLFPNMLIQAEGEGSGAPTEPQPTPSPTHPSTGDQPPESSSSHDTIQDSRDSLEGTNGSKEDQVQSPHDSPLSGGHTSDRAKGALNLEELFSICTNLSNRVLALETIKDAQAVKIITLRARIKKLEKKCKPSISHHRAWLKSVQRLSMKKRFGKKEYVSKQGRKRDKPEPTLDDSTFDVDLDVDHGMDYMDTEEPVNEGRLSEEIKELVSTARPEDSTIRPDFSTADPIAPPTRQRQRCFEEPEPVKKTTRSDLNVAQTAKDAEVARLVYEEELAELKGEKEKRQGEEEASKAAIAKMYNEVQADIKADTFFAAKL